MVFSSQPRHVFGEGITNLRYRSGLLFQTLPNLHQEVFFQQGQVYRYFFKFAYQYFY